MDEPIVFEIRGYKFTGYVETEQHDIKRLYICAPAPLSCLWSNKWAQSMKLGEVFSFAAAITGTNGIYPWFYTSALIHITIFRRHSLELRGLSPIMTWRSIHPQIQGWLFTKGFNKKEDIEALENLSGSLI